MEMSPRSVWNGDGTGAIQNEDNTDDPLEWGTLRLAIWNEDDTDVQFRS